MKNLILLHGALGNEALFVPLVEALQSKYQCYRFNFSGHGGAPFQAEFSIEQFAAELNTFMEQNDIADATVFGHSMGGYAALYASAMGNTRINKIITLGTKFEWTHEIAAKESSMFDVATLKIKLPSFVAQLEQQHGMQWEQLVHEVKRLLISLGDQPVLTDSLLQKISIPVIILRGENDKMVNQEESIKTQLQIPNAQFLSLPAQPHLLERVNLEMLVKVIEERVG